MQAMASETVDNCAVNSLLFFVGEGAEDTGDGAGPAGGVSADAYPDAGYFLGAEGADDGLDAVVTAGAALHADADSCRGEGPCRRR